jgi:hypothetical protein
MEERIIKLAIHIINTQTHLCNHLNNDDIYSTRKCTRLLLVNIRNQSAATEHVVLLLKLSPPANTNSRSKLSIFKTHVYCTLQDISGIHGDKTRNYQFKIYEVLSSVSLRSCHGFR